MPVKKILQANDGRGEKWMVILKYFTTKLRPKLRHRFQSPVIVFEHYC